MKAHADRLAPGRIRFNHELVELDQDADGVSALVRDRASGETYRVRCDYLIGADGGRTVPGLLGIGYEGLGVVSQTATIHATVDLSRWAADEDVLLRWVISPQYGAGVVLVPMGPERWGPDSEEWVIHVFYPVDADPEELSDERVRPTPAPRWASPRPRDGGAHRSALESRGRDRGVVPLGPRVPRRGRRAPAPAYRRPRPHERDPGRAQPLLEARRGTRRRCGDGAARQLRARAAQLRRTQRPAKPRERRKPPDDRPDARSVAREQREAELGQHLARLERCARARRGARGRAPADARELDGVRRAERRVRVHLRVPGDRPRRHTRAAERGRCPRLRALDPSGVAAPARLARGRRGEPACRSRTSCDPAGSC